jgi:hypothetical protein
MITDLIFKHEPCPVCTGEVIGRSDKIYCSVKCKNAHHRSVRLYFNTRFTTLEKRLRRNLVVLEGVLGTKRSAMSVHKNVLFKHGFELGTNTSSYRKGKRTIYEIENYMYIIDHKGILHIRRMVGLSDNMPVYFRRWKIEFPDDLECGEKLENEAQNQSILSQFDESS